MRKQKKSKNIFLYILLMILSTLSAFSMYAYMELQKPDKALSKNQTQNEQLVEKMKTVRKDEQEKSKKLLIQKNLEEIRAEKITTVASEIEDYIANLRASGKEIQEYEIVEEKIIKDKFAFKKKKRVFKKPRLAIIIDDVSFNRHVNQIKKLPFIVTPSFLPPTNRHPDTHELARKFEIYMIHLPMEASSFIRPEENTILVSNSSQMIDNRIKMMKKWFPKAKLINNHTGSKFTADFEAMKKLFPILENYQLEFVDSRTTQKTQALAAAKEYNKDILSRDIFLDNKPNVTYIKKQLRKAVRLAKKNGYAIAIGHPRRETFKALMSSKDLLNGVDVVYVNELL